MILKIMHALFANCASLYWLCITHILAFDNDKNLLNQLT